MNLRARTALILLAGFVLFLGTGLAGGYFLLVSGLEKLEAQQSARELEQVRQALGQEARTMGRTASDWGNWDATYRFAADRDPAYAAENLTDTALRDIHLEFILIFDPQGRPVESRFHDLDKGVPSGGEPWQEALVAFLGARHEPLMKQGGSEGVMTVSAAGPFLVGVRPILTSEGKGPARGFLAVGRRVGPLLVGELAERIRLDLALIPLRPVPVGEDGRALARLTGGSGLVLIPFAGGRLAAYSLIPGLEGEPGLMARVRGDRSIYGPGLRLLVFAFLGILVGALLLWLGASLLFTHLIFAPLSRLATAVQGVGHGSGALGRVPAGREDEIGALARAINRGLDEIEGAMAAAERERERLAVTLDSVDDGVVAVDDGGTVLVLNPKAEELTGWSREEAKGRLAAEVLRVEDARGKEVELELLPVNDDFPSLGPLMVVRKDGDRRQVSVRVNPVTVEKGRGTGRGAGSVVVLRDEVGHRRVERERADLHRIQTLFHMTRAGVQEISARQGALRGHLDSLGSQVAGDPLSERAVEQARESLGAAQTLLRRLSVLIVPKEGGVRRWDPVTLAHRAAESTFHGTLCTGELDFPPGLPSIEGGEGPLLFLFESLFAFLAPDPGKPGRLRVRGRKTDLDPVNPFTLSPGAYLEVTIEDEGPERPSGNLRRVFEPAGIAERGEVGHRLMLAHALVGQLQGNLAIEGRGGRNVLTLLLPECPGPSPGPRTGGETRPREGREQT